MQPIDATRNLNDWLCLLEARHESREIKLGTERVQQVGERLGCLSLSCPVVTVAGTNGKGTTVALLEALLGKHYRVGTYTSPHLRHFSERIRLNSAPILESELCEAFKVVERARGQTVLSFFEFTTLAALVCFQRAALDVVILEVGLGGRLDAVNAVDPDLAIITAIDIDHEDWLGKGRENIGFEKAGIMRPQKPVVCSDPNPPKSILTQAEALSARLHRQGSTFHYQTEAGYWRHSRWPDIQLPVPAIPLDNASGALEALYLLQTVLPVPVTTLSNALNSLQVPGRLHWLPNQQTPTVMDVAHNPQAVQYLADYLRLHPTSGQTYAVFSNLKTKPLAECLEPLLAQIEQWFVAPLDSEQARSVEAIRGHLKSVGAKVVAFNTMPAAMQAAQGAATREDRIVVFGSFHTVAEVLTWHAMQ